MANTKGNISLVDKLSLYTMSKTGETSNSKNNSLNDKVYVVIPSSDENQTSKSTSPSILGVRNNNTGEVIYSADEVKRFSDLRKQGKMSSEFSMQKEPVETYLKKEFSQYQVAFEDAIKSNGNENLPVVLRYIKEAYESNNKAVLGQMLELISGRANFEFMFRGGSLNINKIKRISELSDSDIINGINALEDKVNRDIIHSGARMIYKAATKGAPELPRKIKDDAVNRMYEASAVEIDTTAIDKTQDKDLDDKEVQPRGNGFVNALRNAINKTFSKEPQKAPEDIIPEPTVVEPKKDVNPFAITDKECLANIVRVGKEAGNKARENSEVGENKVQGKTEVGENKAQGKTEPDMDR